jgi:ParB family transcriptional regulator, chromosome partitioning protein
MPKGNTSQHLRNIAPDDIRKNPENPRLVFRQNEMENLMVSIARIGVQVPITVYAEGKHYRLLDGERRWRCARKLNLSDIPALVKKKPTELKNLLLMYNIHALREQWDYFTIASKLTRVIDLYTSTHRAAPNEIQLSEATGLSRGQIRRCQLLLELPKRFQDLLLHELELPKARQKLNEDLFIEMERSLKAVVRRIPVYANRVDKIRDVLIAKYRAGTIPAVTDFRQLSKIATATDDALVSKSKARRALDGVFDPESETGIREAYESTVEFIYDEQKAARQVAQLVDYVNGLIADGQVDELETAFLRQLRALEKSLRKLLASR